jgi:hypothetical protein
MYFKGGKNSRGGNQRVTSYDPDDSTQQTANDSTKAGQQGLAKAGSNNSQPPTLGSTRKFSQKPVPTISQNYNEKSMLLSSDEEYQ